MDNAKPIHTPAAVDASLKLVKTTEDCKNVDQVQFQSAVGSLPYLSIMTRPDSTYAVSNVAKFCASPFKQHWTAVKRIVRYLNGTLSLSLGLLYRKDGSSCCIGYCDADWAGDTDDRKSTSGCVPDQWCSNQLEKQETVMCGTFYCGSRVRCIGKCSTRSNLDATIADRCKKSPERTNQVFGR